MKMVVILYHDFRNFFKVILVVHLTRVLKSRVTVSGLSTECLKFFMSIIITVIALLCNPQKLLCKKNRVPKTGPSNN